MEEGRPPQYKSCEISLFFGDGEHLFKLGIKQIGELQEKCHAGIGAIFARVFSGNYYMEDLFETARLGLIGGGLSPFEAHKLATRHCEDMPKVELWSIARAVLIACAAGYDDGTADKKKDGETMEDGSISPKPTATEPFGDSDPEKSTASPSGSTAH